MLEQERSLGCVPVKTLFRSLRVSSGRMHRAVTMLPDNALAETINGLYKAEVIHRPRPWLSLEAIEYATLEWGD